MGFKLFGGKSEDMELEPVVMEQEEPYPPADLPISNTVIAGGVTVLGTLEGEGVIQVEGTVKGEISLNGAVIVKPTGLVQGPITAEIVQIAGSVEGDCIARDHMRLESTGSLDGDVTTLSLIIEDGGRFNGRSNMVKELPPAGQYEHGKRKEKQS